MIIIFNKYNICGWFEILTIGPIDIIQSSVSNRRVYAVIGYIILLLNEQVPISTMARYGRYFGLQM